MDERISKLPVWAQEHIKKLEYANEPLLQECVKLRKETSQAKELHLRYKAANEALIEILRAAANGGHDVARQVVDILDGYEIFRA